MSVLMPELAAQKQAMRTVEQIIFAGRAHALLFTGEPDNGPLAAALSVAKSVLTPADTVDVEAIHGRIERGVHPDLLWVSAEGGSLAIDQIRKIIEMVAMLPFEAPAQVIVIEQADTLSSDNADAANSLLKALEEPAGRVVFVLVARRPARILPTIRSRVIEVNFPSVPDKAVIDALQSAGINDQDIAVSTGLNADELVRIARGSVARAMALVQDERVSARRADILNSLERVLSGEVEPSQLARLLTEFADKAGAIAEEEATVEFEAMLELMSSAEQKTFKSKTNDQGMKKRTDRRVRRARIVELRSCLDEIASWWRDVMACAAGATKTIVNVDHEEQITRFAAQLAGVRAVAALDAIDDIEARLTINNAAEGVALSALSAELAALAAGKIRARRSMGLSSRTPAGYDLYLG